ncbi:nucleotidyltransferase family protein [Candidatus Poriferisocius sp.]|uniref:nucleotidyltransferase family protein n=1 Tax=Candidatus Poriferisocius sp. TaxID=3101276 RepID=UPI003B023038
MGTAAVLKASDVPTLEDAKRVAQVFVGEYGVGAVLLFGSVAEGVAGSGSDLDLVAVYDDLDYSTRYQRWKDLKFAARKCVGYEIDLLVTDRPEWKLRTEAVGNSFECGIAGTTRILLDKPGGKIDWEKEIGMPDSEQKETDEKLGDMGGALREIEDKYKAREREESARFKNDEWGLEYLRRERLAKICASGAMAIEHGLKALVSMSGKPFARTHSSADLTEEIPEHMAHRYAVIPEDLLGIIYIWRQAGSYESELTQMHLSTEDLARLASQYTEAATHFAKGVLEEYVLTYPEPGQQASWGLYM